MSSKVTEAFAATHVDYPDFVKKLYDLLPLADDMYENWVLYEIPNENFIEGMTFVTMRYNKMVAAVPSFSFKLVPMLSDVDAMKVLE